MSGDSLYTSKLVWLLLFLALHWAFCLFWGVRSAQRAKTAADFFVAGRDLPLWVFITATTASAFAGWAFFMEPALVLRDGLQAGYIAFAAVVVPLPGILFLKRQWMLGKRFGYLTPGEMFAHYYQSDLVRLFSVAVALLFAVPFLALLLSGAGHFASLVSDGLLSRESATWLLAALLVIYVTLGGLRAAAYVTTMQSLLIAAAVLILGLAALHLLGGFEGLNRTLAGLGQGKGLPTTGGYGGGDYKAVLATPGVVQWIDGFGRDAPTGGPWTGIMVLTFLLSLLGIQSSPLFSLWAFSSRDPRPFGPQQLWASACAVGLLLFVFGTIIGLGGLLLGGNTAVTATGLGGAAVLPPLDSGTEGQLLAAVVNVIGEVAPWLAGVLAVAVVAGIKASAGPFLAAAGTIVTRDLYQRYFNAKASQRLQRQYSRVAMLIMTAAALVMAALFRDAMVLLAGLALSLSVQLFPALLGVTWLPWLTRRGIVAGLAVGTVAVVATDGIGQALTAGSLPWGQWPWTIHAAVWGLGANLLVAAIASALTQRPAERAHRETFHRFLADHAPSVRRRRLSSFAWVVTFVWLFFAIGPGIVLGNYLFGAPDAGYEGWDFAMPSIWAWQLLWWGLGVLLVWLLAYKMEFSTMPTRNVIALAEDFGSALSAPAGQPGLPGGQQDARLDSHGRA